MTPQEALKLKARARLRLRQSPAAAPPQQQAIVPTNEGGFDQFKQMFQSGQLNPSQSVHGDVARQFQKGLGEGTISGLGMFGDAAALSERATQGGAEYLGAPDWLSKGAGKAARYATGPFANMPTSEQMTGAVEDVTGPFNQAKTVPGQYARTIGQFAPAAVAGPGSISRKAAMMTIPALASETGGQLTKGTGAEPYARLGGALAGGLAAAGRGGGPMKHLRQNADDLATVGTKTDAAYARLRDAGIQYDQNSYRSFAMKTLNALRKHGWRPRDGDPITSDLKEILGRLDKPNDFAEMENLRQFVGNLPKTASDTDFARSHIIKDALSDFIDNGKVISTKGIDPASIAAMTKEARELGRRNILGKQIAKMGDKSEWYLGGKESGLRNQTASFGRQQGKSLTPVERDAFKKVVRREGVLSGLNTMGSKLGQAALATAGFALGDISGGAGALGLHYGARKLSEATTRKAINDALKTVLAGRPAQKAAMKAGDKEKFEALVRTLLATGSGHASAVRDQRSITGP